MPEREQFPSHYFEGNPLEGCDPIEAYQRLQWGNPPKAIFSIQAPESLVMLGQVAQINMDIGIVHSPEHRAPYLAVGTHTNYLYVIPKRSGRPVPVPRGPYDVIGTVFQLDYYSDKGGEPAYYYHMHEEPFPTLFGHRSGVMVLVPATLESGARSYAVSDEGVIG